MLNAGGNDDQNADLVSRNLAVVVTFSIGYRLSGWRSCLTMSRQSQIFCCSADGNPLR